ncbi:FimV/HubP family polar landmark protein [Aeromonas sanarellii]|uniref:FimV/HubP family polar landmark protein n=1 Tax=Aeromonas sanarellii TaxID=633415 RepID=UPI0039A0B4EC
MFFLILYIVFFMISSANAASSFVFESYDIERKQLYMRLVTPTMHGEVLLDSGRGLIPIENAVLENVFTLRVPISCELLNKETIIYWFSKGRPTLHASIPAQSCQHYNISASQVFIVEEKGQCWIIVGKHTLWRAALELSKHNNATVYQNLYALFINNKPSFIGEDINRLKDSLLRCPSEQLIKKIHPKDAYRLFTEMLYFNQRQSTQ